jgi:multisubunit Na+/H+ antiporter MnhE subunit
MTTARRKLAQALFLSAALMIFWIACVATFRAPELYVGIPATLLTAAFCLFAVRKLPIRFRPTLTELLELWRLPWYVVQDLAVIIGVLILDCAGRRAPSLFRSAPWRANADNGHDTARRALAVAYTTISPNCVVIGIDRERRQFFFHQLKAAGLPIMTRRLGAGEAP